MPHCSKCDKLIGKEEFETYHGKCKECCEAPTEEDFDCPEGYDAYSDEMDEE